MSDADLEDMEDQTYSQFVSVVHRLTGITLLANRKTMLQGRLRRRLRQLDLLGFKDYLEYLSATSEEAQAFINLVTTNETYFYRTPRIWDYIEKEFLVDWHLKHPGVVFKAWSAAASSGEEAHTLGVLPQHFKELHPSFQYQIFATDISEEVLTTARQGLYSGRSIESFQKSRPELFQKFMKPAGSGAYTTLAEIHSKITFELSNLIQPPKFKASFDLVLIRNVLIYFASVEQEKVLQNIYQTMKKGSALIIGESESLNSLQTPFVYQRPSIYSPVLEKDVREAV